MSSLDFLSIFFLLAGSIFVLLAAIGIYRFQNIYMQMHAATKSATLGCGLILLGVGFRFQSFTTMTEVLILIVFIAITNPLSSHLIAKRSHSRQ